MSSRNDTSTSIHNKEHDINDDDDLEQHLQETTSIATSSSNGDHSLFPIPWKAAGEKFFCIGEAGTMKNTNLMPSSAAVSFPTPTAAVTSTSANHPIVMTSQKGSKNTTGTVAEDHNISDEAAMVPATTNTNQYYCCNINGFKRNDCSSFVKAFLFGLSYFIIALVVPIYILAIPFVILFQPINLRSFFWSFVVWICVLSGPTLSAVGLKKFVKISSVAHPSEVFTKLVSNCTIVYDKYLGSEMSSSGRCVDTFSYVFLVPGEELREFDSLNINVTRPGRQGCNDSIRSFPTWVEGDSTTCWEPIGSFSWSGWSGPKIPKYYKCGNHKCYRIEDPMNEYNIMTRGATKSIVLMAIGFTLLVALFSVFHYSYVMYEMPRIDELDPAFVKFAKWWEKSICPKILLCPFLGYFLYLVIYICSN
jgi:hypothetical protein